MYWENSIGTLKGLMSKIYNPKEGESAFAPEIIEQYISQLRSIYLWTIRPENNRLLDYQTLDKKLSKEFGARLFYIHGYESSNGKYTRETRETISISVPHLALIAQRAGSESWFERRSIKKKLEDDSDPRLIFGRREDSSTIESNLRRYDWKAHDMCLEPSGDDSTTFWHDCVGFNRTPEIFARVRTTISDHDGKIISQKIFLK